MENIYEAVKDSPFLKGISFHEFNKTVHCLQAKSTSYKKNDMIWQVGTPAEFIGLLMSGSVRVVKDDTDGNTLILADVAAPNFLGEIGVWAELESFPIAVQAVEDCHVIFLDGKKAISVCPSACLFHRKMIENMLQTISKKAFMLDQKVEMLSKRTVRERLLYLFSTQKGSKKFTLPYNREEMARYLYVNRSALSDELSKMRDEGLIRYRLNEFEIL